MHTPLNCARSTPARNAGFTLIELLVGLAVLLVLSMIAYSALDEAYFAQAKTEEHADRTAAILRAVTLLQQDFEQLSPRTIRDEFGDTQAALKTIENDAFQVIEFSRGGWRNPLNQTRSELMRAGYGLKEDKLIRYQWIVMDRAQDSEARQLELLDDLESLSFRFLKSGDWSKTWPPKNELGESKADSKELPAAVEVTLELKDWGTITRLFHGKY